MYLDAVSTQSSPVYESVGGNCGRPLFEAWEHWQPARVSHHGLACCEIVKEWIISTDQSLLNGGNEMTGPRWIRHKFEWGPTRYPIYWCEIGRAKVLDCGVHAALAQEVFLARGVRSFRAQMVQEFTESAAAQWQLQWEDRDAITTWMDGDLIYHEGCTIVGPDGETKLWDPSAGWWIDARSTTGYGSLRALRIVTMDGTERFDWGGRIVPANEWTVTEPSPKPTNRSNRTSSLVRPLPARTRLRSV